MMNARTISDVTNMMSKTVADNEEAFWKYVYGRAARAIKRGNRLHPVEEIALKRDGNCSSPASVTNTVSTITRETFEDMLKSMNEYFYDNIPNSLVEVVKCPTISHMSDDQKDAMWSYVEDKVIKLIRDGDSPYNHDDCGCVEQEFYKDIKGREKIHDVVNIDDPRQDVRLPDPDVLSEYDDDDGEYSTITSRTNATFIDRMIPSALRYREIVKDVSEVPPLEVLDGLPGVFHPQPGATPYGRTFDLDNGGLFELMFKYTRCDNIKPEPRGRMLVVLLQYINRFHLYDSKTKSVLRIRYNKRGHVREISEFPIDCIKEDYWDLGNFSDRRGENVFDIWKKMHCRHRIYKTVCEPTRDPVFFIVPDKHGKINKFLGLRVELKYDLANWVLGTIDVSPIETHLKRILAQNDEYIYRWLLKWLYLVLIKKSKTGIALIFFGDQGTGKSLFFDNFVGGSIMGDESYHSMVGLNRLVGRFNASTGNKLLICADEVDARTKHKSDVLKAQITQQTKNVEKKGREVETTRDVSNLVITTNHGDCIRIEETDRRYFIQEIPLPRMGVQERYEYFDNLLMTIEEPLAAPEFYVWLKRAVETDMDVMKIDIRKIPMTQAKFERMTDDQHPMYQWLQERYMHNPTWRENEIVVQHDLFRSFTSSDEYRNVKITPHAFTKMFKTLGFEEGPAGRGRCWKMMPFDVFRSAMQSKNKWKDI